jgi:glycosyltransferase involved in cell wall biosynthesis
MRRDRITLRSQATANAEIRRVYDGARQDRGRIIEELRLRPHSFVYVGRLSPEKNVMGLLRAYSILTRSCGGVEDWGVLILGDGEQREELIAWCERERLDGVAFCGGRPWNQVPRLFAACDVLVLPSLSEPWGLVVNEALVCGIPAIVSDACGCVEDLILPGQTGWTFAPTDARELSERMAHFVTDPREVERMGRIAEEFIKGFSPQIAARQMLLGIEHACHPGNP